jgi:ectoine hydroxylase-related dioxygenase (phytanoyl-CoA dioxygenase family)
MKHKGFTGSRNWRLIDEDYLKQIDCCRKVLKVNAGDMVLWDSRTFHQNQFGTLPEERLVQYVCFLPKHHPSNTPGMTRTRHRYFEKRRTTSHWPYPLMVNAYHPPDEILEVPRTDLSEYEEEIKKVL